MSGPRKHPIRRENVRKAEADQGLRRDRQGSRELSGIDELRREVSGLRRANELGGPPRPSLEGSGPERRRAGAARLRRPRRPSGPILGAGVIVIFMAASITGC